MNKLITITSTSKLQSLFWSFCIGLICLSASVVSEAQSFKTATEYNDFIVAKQHKIINTNIEYISKLVHADDFETIENHRKEVIKKLEQTIAEMQALPPYKKNTAFRDETTKAFEVYLAAFSQEFATVNLNKMDSEESFENMEALFKAQDAAEAKLSTAGLKVEKAQSNFAKKNNMRLELSENSAAKDMLLFNELNTYNRSVFLQQFKVSKANHAFFTAVNKKNTNTMDKERKQLTNACTDALSNLKTIKPFKNEDDSYQKSGEELVNYYLQLSQKDFKDMVQIIQNKDQLTQQDMDRYNEIIQSFNKESQRLLKQFNQTSEDLLKKYIPKIDGRV